MFTGITYIAKTTCYNQELLRVEIIKLMLIELKLPKIRELLNLKLCFLSPKTYERGYGPIF